MIFFNRETLLDHSTGLEAKETTLSPSTIALILAASGVLEDRAFWDEMTDSEWDEIEALVASLVDECS